MRAGSLDVAGAEFGRRSLPPFEAGTGKVTYARFLPIDAKRPLENVTTVA